MAKKDYVDTIVVPAGATEGTKVMDKYKDLSPEQLRKLLMDKDELIASYKEHKAQDTEEILALKDKVETCDKKYEEIVGANAELQEKLNDLSNASKMTQLNLEKAHKRELEELNKSHDAEVESLKTTVEDLQHELKSEKTEVRNLTSELKRARKKADSSEATVTAMESRYLEDNLREELFLEDEEAVNAEIDACVDEVLEKFEDLKANIKAKRAERFQNKRQIMADKVAAREEKAKNAEEIKRLKESLATLQHVIEAKEAEEA